MHVYYKRGGYKCIIKVLFGWEYKKLKDKKSEKEKKFVFFIIYAWLKRWKSKKINNKLLVYLYY